MEKIKINLIDVRREAKKLPKDGFNERCVHFDDVTGEPVCAVGHILHQLGATPEHLRIREDAYYGKPVHTESAFRLHVVPGLEITKKAQEYLIELQRLADRRMPWGYAVELTEYRLGFRKKPPAQHVRPTGIPSSAKASSL